MNLSVVLIKENKMLKKMIFACALFVSVQILSGCAAVRGVAEGGMAYLENPSMELVLDRLNTAAAASRLGDVIFGEAPISDQSTWPKAMETFSMSELQPIIRALALDGAYAAHGGKISPIKAHIVQVQHQIYKVPPDMYASARSCYQRGEETIINGYYYKINSAHNVIFKSAPSISEIKNALVQGAKNIFITTKCSGQGTFPKQDGLVDYQKLSIGGNTYKSIWAALIDILPNGKELAAAQEDYDEAKKKLKQKSEEISILKKDKRRLKRNEKPYGRYHSKATIDEQINIKKAEMQTLKEAFKEKNNILKTTFDGISEHKGTVQDPRKLKTLENIVAACKGVKGVLYDSLSLTTTALAKLPSSITGLPNEFKQLTSRPKGAQYVYLPIRLARLRFNAGNIIDNIKTIASVIKNDLGLVRKIHKEVKGLIKINAVDSTT